MGDLPACDAPDPFDGIEFWRVRWEKEPYQAVLMVGEEAISSPPESHQPLPRSRQVKTIAENP